MHFKKLKNFYIKFPNLQSLTEQFDEYLYQKLQEHLLKEDDSIVEIKLEEVIKALNIEEVLALVFLGYCDDMGLVEPHYYFYCPEDSEPLFAEFERLPDTKKISCPNHQDHPLQSCGGELTFRFTF